MIVEKWRDLVVYTSAIVAVGTLTVSFISDNRVQELASAVFVNGADITCPKKAFVHR